MTKSPGLLAVIDMQNIFAQDGSQWQTPGFDQLIEPTKALITAYAPRVVMTRFVSPAPLEPFGSWRPYYQDWPFALQPPQDPIWDVVPELADLAPIAGVDGRGDSLVATTFSKWGPRLAELTGPGGRLVLTGVSTDCCVLSTALAAADAGVEVQVVKQATAGINETTTAQALAIMALYGPLIAIIDLDQALAEAPGQNGAV